MTMGFEGDGDPPLGSVEDAADATEVGMDLEETPNAVEGKSVEHSGRSSLQTEAAKTAGTTPTVMQKIDETDDDGKFDDYKYRKWRKINIAIKVDLIGEEISSPNSMNTLDDGSDEPMKHHPIMSKLAKFVAAAQKKCKTVKIMSSKNRLVLDTKVCIDSWSINRFKEHFAYSVIRNRQRNVQVTLHIDYGETQSLWKLKQKLLDTLQAEGLWIINHNGPIDVVETTQTGFVAKFHPNLHRVGFQNKLNTSIKDFLVERKTDLMLRAQLIPGIKDWAGEKLPEVQIIPLTLQGSYNKGNNSKIQAVGISVQSKYKSLFRYILTTICYDMGYDYVDFTMKYDTQLKPTYNKLVRTHEEFMFNHKIINIHQMERSEMQTCLKDLQTITTVMSVDETVITEKNGTWVLVMQNPLVQKDLEKIDSIISNNPVMTNRKFNHLPFRKRQPSESMNTDAISSQKDRLKDFTATPLGSNDTWSSKLFPPRNITTRKGGASNKTTISIDDETVTTLADTVATLQRQMHQMEEKMRSTTTTITSIKERVTIGESKGKKQAAAIGVLESNQERLATTVTGQMKLINDNMEEAKAEKAESDRVLHSMLQQLLNSNSNSNDDYGDSNNLITPPPVQTNITNNNNAQQVQIYSGATSTQNTLSNTGSIAPSSSGTVKRNITSMSDNNERVTNSPEKSKQKQNEAIPIEIDFNKFTNDGTNATEDTEMETQTHIEAAPPEIQRITNDTDMDYGEGNQDSNNIGYLGSEASLGTRDSHETLTVVEEEQSITSHNFNNGTEGMDYTTGFLTVMNGSPIRQAVRQRMINHLSPNPYSALNAETNRNNNDNNNNSNTNDIDNNNNNNIESNQTNTSAKTDMHPHNE